MFRYIFKIVFIGDANVGKTSIISQYINNRFINEYKPTIGVDFNTKQFNNIVESKNILLHIWDTTVHDNSISCLKGASAGIFVFDATRLSTLESCKKYKNELLKLCSDENRPCLLIANKWDLVSESDRPLLESVVAEFCRKNNFYRWAKISAKTGSGIEKCMNDLVENILTQEITRLSKKEPISRNNDCISQNCTIL